MILFGLISPLKKKKKKSECCLNKSDTRQSLGSFSGSAPAFAVSLQPVWLFVVAASRALGSTDPAGSGFERVSAESGECPCAVLFRLNLMPDAGKLAFLCLHMVNLAVTALPLSL